MKTKEEVKQKLIGLCERLKITPPVTWSYDNVKRVSALVNKKIDEHNTKVREKAWAITREEVNQWTVYEG